MHSNRWASRRITAKTTVEGPDVKTIRTGKEGDYSSAREAKNVASIGRRASGSECVV